MNTGTIWAFDLGKGFNPSPRWGDPNNDIQPVSKEALIGAIKKCHQTLWAGGKLSPLAAL
jgi:type I restriction enzyme M protein